MVHLHQPEGSSLCGQTCVAMAAGVSLDRAIEVFGNRNSTYTRQLVAALRVLGLECADRLRRVSKNRVTPPRAILCARWLNRKRKPRLWHWVLVWDGRVYDPAGRYPEGYGSDCEFTSYLEIFS